METNGQLVVGFIRGSHGVSGEFKVESASGYYDHIEVLKEVTLRHGSDSRKCKVEFAEKGCGTLYMKLAGIDSPEEGRQFNQLPLLYHSKSRNSQSNLLCTTHSYQEDERTCGPQPIPIR